MTKPVTKYIHLFSIQTGSYMFNLYFQNIFHVKSLFNFLILIKRAHWALP